MENKEFTELMIGRPLKQYEIDMIEAVERGETIITKPRGRNPDAKYTQTWLKLHSPELFKDVTEIKYP